MSSPSIVDAHRRIKALKDYVLSVDDTVLLQEGKDDICGWLDFICAGWDSTVLMQWFGAFSSVMGYYLALLQERIDQQKLVKDKSAALARKHLETQQTKTTVDQAKNAALMDPVYTAAAENLIKLERLYNFLSFVKEGLDPKIIEAFGHNQRLQQKHDVE